MVIDSFGRLDEIAEPVDGAESVEMSDPEYLAVAGIMTRVGLIDKVENLSTQTKYRN